VVRECAAASFSGVTHTDGGADPGVCAAIAEGGGVFDKADADADTEPAHDALSTLEQLVGETAGQSLGGLPQRRRPR